MENRYYTCHYCKKEFIPKRRGIQKFCSASCRASSHRLHKESKVQQNQQEVSQHSNTNKKTGLKEFGISAGAALTGNYIYDKLTPLKNRAATKGDLQLLLSELKQSERYYEVRNLPGRLDGVKPFFDIIERKIVHFSDTNEKLLKI